MSNILSYFFSGLVCWIRLCDSWFPLSTHNLHYAIAPLLEDVQFLSICFLFVAMYMKCISVCPHVFSAATCHCNNLAFLWCSFRVTVLMHPHYIQCCRVLFLLVFLARIVCLSSLEYKVRCTVVSSRPLICFSKFFFC